MRALRRGCPVFRPLVVSTNVGTPIQVCPSAPSLSTYFRVCSATHGMALSTGSFIGGPPLGGRRASTLLPSWAGLVGSAPKPPSPLRVLGSLHVDAEEALGHAADLDLLRALGDAVSAVVPVDVL